MQSHYEQEYNTANAAITSANTQHGLTICDSLLANPELPRYYRIKILVLMASATSNNWRQKELCVYNLPTVGHFYTAFPWSFCQNTKKIL
jgi:hypothetical protein